MSPPYEGMLLCERTGRAARLDARLRSVRKFCPVCNVCLLSLLMRWQPEARMERRLAWLAAHVAALAAALALGACQKAAPTNAAAGVAANAAAPVSTVSPPAPGATVASADPAG